MPKKLFTGVDGGSTKTLTVTADEEGIVIGAGESGPSNYHVVGVDKAVENINSSIKQSLSGTGIEAPDVVTLGLAGMDTQYDFKFFEEKAVPRILGAKVYVRHDAEIALVGATKGEPGVIVIAGTGSAAGARNRKGEYARCGGWGYIVGDEGSAYYLGRRALTAVLWAYDGRGEPTILTEKVLEKLEISSVDEIVKKVYVEKMTVREMARLAPLVTEAAKNGDKVAKKIIDDAAYNLALHVIALARRLNMEDEQPIKVAPVGGVFRAGDIILNPFKKYIEKHYKVEIIKPAFPPAVGALLLSYMFSQVEITDALIENIAKTVKKFKVYV